MARIPTGEVKGASESARRARSTPCWVSWSCPSAHSVEVRMPLDEGVNKLNETPRTHRATQIARCELLCCYSAARTKPITADPMRMTGVSENNIARSARLCFVTLTKSLLQFLCQWHPTVHALQMTVYSLSQTATAFGAMEFHGATTPNDQLTDDGALPSRPNRSAAPRGRHWAERCCWPCTRLHISSSPG